MKKRLSRTPAKALLLSSETPAFEPPFDSLGDVVPSASDHAHGVGGLNSGKVLDQSFTTEDIANGQALVPGMGRRMVAYMIDFLFCSVLGVVLLMAVLWTFTKTDFANHLANLYAVFVFCGLVNGLHHVFMESHPRWRATVGKLIMGLAVVDAQAQPINRRVALQRFFWRLPSVFTCGFLYLIAGIGNYGLALHDRKTATLTVVRHLTEKRMVSGLCAGREFTWADKACLIAAALFLCNMAYNLIRAMV